MSDQQGSGRRADRTGATAPGRRGLASRRKVDLLVVLGIVLPLVVAVAAGVIRSDDAGPWPDAPPSAARLTDASVVCAAAASSTAGDVAVSRLPGLPGGEVAVRVAEDGAPDLAARGSVPARSGELSTIASGGDVLVTGTDAAAPGLVAGRTGDARAAAECRGPSYDEWYVGIGAAAQNSSTIELVNPDLGPAIVEIALYGRGKPIVEDELHGIRVPGRGVVRLDVSDVEPRKATLAAHVTVVRGRVVTTVRQTFDPLGRGTPRYDFLPAQPEPATENLLLGVPSDGEGQVYVFNPGEDEARATIRVVSESATFAPAGLDELVIPAGTVRAVPLSAVLTDEAAEGALGLEVVSELPLVASVRLLGEDLGLVAPVTPVELGQAATAVVPAGPKLLVLGGAVSAGTVRVTAIDARGRRLLDEERVEVGADRGHRLRLPADTVLVTIEASNTPIASTVMLTGDRVGALRMRPAEVDAEVPVVRPE